MMTISLIDERRKRLRLTVKALADKAGVHPDTAHRAFKRATRPLNETVERLDRALKAEEETLALSLMGKAS